ncbi:MAG: monofunctional biosynthetic peptidoglycan transglycosylase [Cytophagaceae bacterium]|nr:monofunctional biosynthetic peptidoglycan transglycosylase [Cytophagaceae bacterium]
MKEAFRNIFKKGIRYLKILIIFFFCFSIFSVILYRFLPPPITPLMIIRVGEQWWDGKEMRLKKEWKSIDEISPNLPLAVVAAEDQKFLQHNGFDWEAIGKAYDYNIKKKRKGKVRGASTISQQVAKNVFLWPGRSWIRKGLEVYFTVLIELMWSKERIMEVYLNVVEMGEGIYGVQAASEFFFKRPAQKLSKDQAAALSAVLPNPRKYSPVKLSKYLSARKIWIRQNMNYIGSVKFN